MNRAALIVLALVALATAGVLAQTAAKPAPQKPAPVAVGPNFVDANGDGICDNFAAMGGRQGRGFGRGMGAGAGQGMGPGAGRGLGAGVGRGMGGGRGMGVGAGAGLAFGANGESLVDGTARVTGMTTGDVRAALADGRTFAQIVEEHGKSTGDLLQSMLTSRQELVAKAVAGGRLTQEQADLMMGQMKLHLEQLLSSAWQRLGRGRGFQGQCPFAGTAPAAPIKK